jgi:hypothetical protein
MSGEFLALLVLNPDGTPLRLNRVRGRWLAKEEFLAPLLAGEPLCNSVDDHVEWPRSETAT